MTPVTRLPLRTRQFSANAATLLWQSRARALVVAGIVGGWVLFRWRGPGTALGSIASVTFDRATVLWLALSSVLVYLLVTAGIYLWVRRRGVATTRLVLAALGMDVVLIFLATLLTTPQNHFDRALIVSFFVLYFAQLYQGVATAAVTAAGIALMYVVLLIAAASLPMPLDWTQELWTLWLFLAGVLGLLLLHGHAAARLERLVRLFERVEDGDFAEEYDVARDQRPDNLTIVGRAYNAMRAQLATIVLTDPLSGCMNRRGFEEALTREAARAARAGSPIALLSLDVDFFKRINDSFGHLAGDAVIRELGAMLRETARAGDIVGRLGGEEFAIVAPETGVDGASELAGRVLEAMRSRQFAGVDGRQQITVSIGIAADDVASDGMTESLRARADEALYAAKRAGRNRVVVWEHGMRLLTQDAERDGAGAAVEP